MQKSHSIITPLDIAKTADLNDQLAVNIAVFLQSLDEDGDPANGISISKQAHGSATKQIDFKVPSAIFAANTDLQDLLKNSGAANTSLVSEDSAKAHLQNTLSGNNGIPKINIAPVAKAGIGQDVAAGATVSLSGEASSDANGDSITYAWAFVSQPAGSSAALANPTSVDPTFVADVAGTFVIGLTVNDGSLSSPVSNVTITAAVANAVPVANAGSSQSVTIGSTVTINGSGSSDANGDSLTYVRSGSVCLNNFPRFISGLRANYGRCRVVHGGGRRLRRTDRRGGQLGAHRGCHLTLPASLAATF